MNLKEQEGYMEGFGRRKGKWKECNYIINLKIILRYYTIMSKIRKHAINLYGVGKEEIMVRF